MGLRSKLSVSSKLVLPSANEKIWLRLERLVVVTSGRCASRVRTNRYRALDSVSVTSFRYLNEMACDSSLVRQQVARWAAESWAPAGRFKGVAPPWNLKVLTSYAVCKYNTVKIFARAYGARITYP